MLNLAPPTKTPATSSDWSILPIMMLPASPVSEKRISGTAMKRTPFGNLRYETKSGIRIDVWDYYLENIFNLGYLEAHYTHPFGGAELSYALQYIDQRQSGDGGNGEDNLNPTNATKAKSYMQEGEKSTTYGIKTALKHEHSKLTFA